MFMPAGELVSRLNLNTLVLRSVEETEREKPRRA